MQLFIRQLGRSKASSDPITPRALSRADPVLVLLRDHGPGARLQQEAGGPVLRAVCGPPAVSPGRHRGVLWNHQEEGGRDGTRPACSDRTRTIHQNQNLIGCFCPQLEAFEVQVAPDLQQNLVAVVQELGVHIPPPVSPFRVQSELSDTGPALQSEGLLRSRSLRSEGNQMGLKLQNFYRFCVKTEPSRPI